MRLSLDFTLQPQGMEPHMKLAGLAVQSLMMGTFAALVIAMFCLLCRHAAPQDRDRTGRSPDHRRLLVGLSVLALMVTGHWICLISRAFQGFVWWKNGEQAAVYFAEVNDPAGTARFAFHGATIVVADLFVIGRLYVICDYCKPVVVAPLLSLAGLVVSSAGTTYAYGAYNALVPGTLVDLHRWRLVRSVFTILINVYCTAMVAWHIARYHRGIDCKISTPVMSVVIVIVESAMLYTSTVIVAQVAYETNHVSSYFLVDSIPTTAALTAVLVHARAVLTRARDVYSECEWRSHVMEGCTLGYRRSATRRHVVVDDYDLDNT